jgi:peptide/nickel transport system substrate-binding protein
MSKPKLFVLIVILAATLSLTACSGASPVTAPATEVPQAAQATQAPAPTAVVESPRPVAADQTLVAAFGVGPGGGEPEMGKPWTGGGANHVHIKLYITPTILNEDLSDIIPYALESWEHNDDFTVWTYKLREDILWSDGKPLTAHDWKFTADFVTASDFASDFLNHRALAFAQVVGYEARVRGEADALEGVTVIDDYTVQYTLTSSNPRHHTTQYRTYILPAHAIDFEPSQHLTTDWWLDPSRQISSGPFVVAEFVRDSFLILEKNPRYFEGAPKLDRIIIRHFGGDTTAAVLAFAAGEIHFTYLDPTDVETLRGGYNIFANNSNVPVYTDIHYSTVPEFWQDIRVRQAILYAIDRRAITDQVLNETHFPIPCPVSFPHLWPEDVNWYEYNPERARQLLSEAGVDPSEIVMEWVGHAGYDNIDHNSALQASQAFLADIGIRMTYRFVDVPAFRERYTADGPWTFHYRGSGMPLYPAEYSRAWVNAGADGGDFKGFDMVGAGLEAAVEAINAAPTTEEYFEAIRNFCAIHNETLPDLQLWIGNRYGVASTNVADFWWQPGGGGGPYYDQSHLWEMVEN